MQLVQVPWLHLLYLPVLCIYFFGVDIIIATFLGGLICTARLMLNHHSIAEIYLGLFVGVICQLLGVWIAL